MDFFVSKSSLKVFQQIYIDSLAYSGLCHLVQRGTLFGISEESHAETFIWALCLARCKRHDGFRTVADFYASYLHFHIV